MSEWQVMQQKEIRKYFHLDKEIEDMEKRIGQVRECFYDQTMVSQMVSNGLEFYTESFSVERNVSMYVDVVHALEKYLNRLCKKQHYFRRFLQSLTSEERQYLTDKYMQPFRPSLLSVTEKQTYDEIQEIHEAINLMEGHAPEEKELVIDNNNIGATIDDIAEQLGV